MTVNLSELSNINIARDTKPLTPYESYQKRSGAGMTVGNSMPNPIREIRMTGKLTTDPDFYSHTLKGLTLEQFGELADISKYAMIRIEQGVFGSVPDGLLTKLHLPWLAIRNQYDIFVKHTRQRNFKIFGEHLGMPHEAELNQHPLLALMNHKWSYPDDGWRVRSAMNVTELAKLLCLNQSHINRFVTSRAPQKTVPAELLKALVDNGYDKDEVDAFAETYREWRAAL